MVFVADAEVIKLITSERTGVFEKDPQTYSVLHIYGHNIIGSDGSEWKRQRDISRSVFNEGNVHLVWKESCKMSREAIELLRYVTGPVDVPVFLKRVCCSYTSGSVFGQRIPYGRETSGYIPPGFQLQFGEALQTAAESMVALWAIPSLAYKIPIASLQRYLSHITQSYSELRGHLQAFIDQYRKAILEGRSDDGDLQNDLLRRLVEATMLEKDPKKRLTDEEVLSNVFIFLIAGSETSAHTMSFVLAHLALYPDKQEKVYEEVRNVWSQDEDVVAAENCFQDSSKLEYTLAVFRESLRLFPVAPRLPKVARRDTVLHSRADGSVTSVVVPKDSLVIMDIMGTNHNPAYWGEDALEFRPERFIDTPEYRWPREAFLGFSIGMRSCIGQRAGQTQSLCILAHLLRYYKVGLPPQLEGLPFEQQKKKLLRFWLGSSLTPTDIHLTFTRRGEIA
ncbi:hypothetical protein M422DRAFT_151985 [Sphaerobolus stellatus SS14]|nr:hypothetical protein M422DRAFT_151985 [Sphaerobolus stellatus SS14]